MATSIRSLNRLQWTQYSKSQYIKQLLGDIIAIFYFWIIEIVVFIIAHHEGEEIPSLVVAIIILGFIVPDFIIKLIIEKDNSVMDAFLKTRPVSETVWNRFLALSQFWKPSNLIVPLILLPACFLFLPFYSGIAVFAVLYAASVFNGFIVVRIKHRSPYQSEKEVKSYYANAVKSSWGKYIAGLQFRSLLRLKRQRRSLIYLSVLFYFQCFCYTMSQNGHLGTFYVFLFIYLLSCAIPQNGFAVEANFFNGIWTRPLPIERLLASKYRFGILLGIVGFVLCIPLCIWGNLSFYDLIAFVLFCGCFCNLIMFYDAFNCVPIELFSNSYYSNQKKNPFKVSTLIILGLFSGIGALAVFLFPGWKSQLILSVMGAAGICTYRPFFRWVVHRFMANRYKYMEKYTLQ